MTIADKIEYVATDQLCLDPRNPRLRSEQHGSDQSELLEIMSEWGIEEIATSIVETGYWPQEALIVVEEKLHTKAKANSKIVIEGNRRLAAVRMLLSAYDGDEATPKWKALAKQLKSKDATSLRRLPTILAARRSDADAFLGFRHVTGIKQWDPLEKAAFIAKLIDSGLSYEQVTRRIGSKTPSVRRHYIALRLFRQMEDIEGIDASKIREKFSVLFLSLRSAGTQEYLGVSMDLDPKAASKPLSPGREAHAVRFARWLFGDSKHPPLFTDSRNTDKFGLALASKDARAYLERTENPRFEVAFRLAGGDREELLLHIERAADELEQALSIVQHHATHPDVMLAAKRLLKDVEAFKAHF